jgi:hypothetical protein
MADAEAVEHYLGLDRYGAMTLALQEGRELVDRSPNFTLRRANHRSRRVNVAYDEHGVVVRADLG